MRTKMLVLVFAAMSYGLAGFAADPEKNLLPNGSFEIWGHFAKEFLPLLKERCSMSTFDTEDPLIPVRWRWWVGADLKPFSFSQSTDAHSGKYAMQFKGTSGRFILEYLEVNPRSTYSYGVWVKGAGDISVEIRGIVPEGFQSLATAKGKASGEWQKIAGTLDVPGHIRMIELTIHISKAGDLLIDDAFISAPLDSDYNADNVLLKKEERDADTILFADFEKEDPAIKFSGKASLTSDGGGRFGRGLRINSGDLALIPFKLSDTPAEGTIEFWLSLDAVPWVKGGARGATFFSLNDGTRALARLGGRGPLEWCWRIKDGKKYPYENAVNHAWAMERMSPGGWTHIAATWDSSAVRFYVDGVLAGIQTKPPTGLWATPVNITIGDNFGTWSGVIDEIRISKVKKFGPLIPKGLEAVPFPPPVVDAPVTSEQKNAEAAKPSVDLVAERKKLIGTIPLTGGNEFESKLNTDGNYVYEATSAKLLTAGNAFTMEPDKIVKGLTTVFVPASRYGGSADSGGAYWKLGDIKPGRYWIGLVYQSSSNKQEAPNPADALGMYLNGRVIQCTTIGGPVQIAPDVWFAELQSADAEPLKPGDEIAAYCIKDNFARFARVVLHSKEPKRGPFRTALNFGGNWHNLYAALGVNADVNFVGADRKKFPRLIHHISYTQVASSPSDFLRSTDGPSTSSGEAKAIALCRMVNPLPVPVTVNYECVIRGYYRQVAGRDAETITIQPHAEVIREVPFETTPDDPSYSAEATVKAVNPPLLRQGSGGQADLGWPEKNMLAFFPGYRHYIPWPDPFQYTDKRRIVLTQTVKGVRQTITLNGPWEWGFTADLNPKLPIPDGMKFEKYSLPTGSHMSRKTPANEPEPHSAYVRRSFDLPETVDRSFRLVVSYAFEATAYVNGQKIGNVRGGSTPLIADFTKAAKPGNNELIIVVRDHMAVMNPDYVNPEKPVASTEYLDAPVYFGWMTLGNVTIESAPSVAATDIEVFPSVRKKQIGVHAAVTNHGDKPVQAIVKVTVQDERKTILQIGEKKMSLDPEKAVEISFEKEWADPELWSPDNPHLYVMAIETVDAASGKTLDMARDRFGFRESWIDGAKIMFNGMAVKMHGPPSDLPNAPHLGIYRGPSMSPEYCDEFGYLCGQSISSLSNNSSRHNVERDQLWETAEKNFLISVRHLQNYPCIIAWDLSNEWLSFLGYTGGDVKLGQNRFKKLSDAVRKQDPTRWTFFNGDGNLGGQLDNESHHYMRPYFVGGDGYGMRGNNAYYPDGAFWRPLDRYFLPDESISLRTMNPEEKIRPLKNVLMDTENLWKCGSWMPPGFTIYLGEEDVLSPAVDSGRAPVIWMYKQNLDGHRDVGTSIEADFNPPGVMQRAYLLQTFIMPDIVHHGFSGRALTRQYDLLNDLFRPAELAFRWQLRGPSGKVYEEGKDVRKMASGDLQTGTLSLKLPKVDKRTNFILVLSLESDGPSTGSGQGKFVCGEERDIEVWPDTQTLTGKLERNILLFDPKNTSGDLLKKAGVAFTPVTELSLAEADAANSVVVIGEGTLDETTVSQTVKLEKFVSAGGRVLILAQSVTPGGLPVMTKIEPREWVAQSYVQMKTHPVLDGISDWDLHFWAPDRVVARGSYTKPAGGAVVTLVNSGSDKGLEWVQMMECYRGKGLYLLCQLPVVSKWNDEPMAREILDRMISYVAGDKVFLASDSKLKLMAASESSFEKRLIEVGAKYDIVKADYMPDTQTPLLVDASIQATDEQKANWGKALNDGASIVVCNAQPGDAEWLGKLARQAVKMTVPPYWMWQGRGYRPVFDKLTAGLSHLELYWKQYDGAEQASRQAEDPALTIEPLQDWTVSAEKSKELVFPGALVEIGVGKGRLVIDQRRWWTTNEKLATLANRNVSALMLGLGVGIAPPVPKREMPKNLDYKTIDLTPFANRGLIDDVGEDGKGGWTDQGPKGDLRTFPTGKQNLAGVPFIIGAEPKSCIVLSSRARPFPENLPKEVIIPLGFGVEGLHFLHSSAYTGDGNIVAVYQVQYNDGSTFDVKLIGSENIRDWAGTPGPLVREKGTQSAVAWTGSCPMFNIIGIYRMLWVNPKPEVPVKAVRFFKPGETGGVPVLLGLTAAVSRADNPQTKANAAKAREQLKEALKMLEAKDEAKAEKLLKDAIALDSSLSDAHQALADICEKKGDENVVMDVCRAWAASGAKTPLPYNRIGQIQEKRKDYKEALAAYSKSLEIEWNQPPVIEAKSRLQKLILD